MLIWWNIIKLKVNPFIIIGIFRIYYIIMLNKIQSIIISKFINFKNIIKKINSNSNFLVENFPTRDVGAALKISKIWSARKDDIKYWKKKKKGGGVVGDYPINGTKAPKRKYRE